MSFTSKATSPSSFSTGLSTSTRPVAVPPSVPRITSSEGLSPATTSIRSSVRPCGTFTSSLRPSSRPNSTAALP
ncbi:hypothetical protein ACLESO_51055 [Pyxidicoccus sp. 3LG]